MQQGSNGQVAPDGALYSECDQILTADTTATTATTAAYSLAGTRVAWELFSLGLDLGHHYQITGTYVATLEQHGISLVLS